MSTTRAKANNSGPGPAPSEDAAPKTVQKKPRGKLPTSPEANAAPKTTRRSKRAFQEVQSPSPHKAAHAKSHGNHDRSPSPGFRPVTVKKKRTTQHETPAPAPEEEDKTTKIALPFADTPIINRNKEMRKASADTNRRSSSGMRGRRASSLIDEGRGNGESARRLQYTSSEVLGCATGSPGLCEIEVGTDKVITAVPHPEVPTAEFYKHISADLTEPRRMRCLLGWCGSRALPPKPDAPKQSSKEANDEFQALQAGMFFCKCPALYRNILADCFKLESYKRSFHEISYRKGYLATGFHETTNHSNRWHCERSPILGTLPMLQKLKSLKENSKGMLPR